MSPPAPGSLLVGAGQASRPHTFRGDPAANRRSTHAQQALALRAHFPDASIRVRAGQLTWRGQLQPTPASRAYLVDVVYVGYVGTRRSVVRVVDPPLAPDACGVIPHVFRDGTLCLHEQDEWRPDMPIVNTTLAWTSDWLYLYELWLRYRVVVRRRRSEWPGAARCRRRATDAITSRPPHRRPAPTSSHGAARVVTPRSLSRRDVGAILSVPCDFLKRSMPEPTTSKLGAALKTRRRAKRLTLRDLSDEIGVSFNTLSRVERGHIPDLKNFQRIVDWLDMPAEMFTQEDVSTPEVIARHLRSDRRLSEDAATSILKIVDEMYRKLVGERPPLAIHLRSAKTFTPAAGALLAEILKDFQSGILAE